MLTGKPGIVDDHVFLLGRPPIGELLGFIRINAVDGQSTDMGALTTKWRQANQHVQTLEASEAGIADNPPQAAFPASIQPIADQVRNDPSFQKTYQFVPVEFAMVELDRLVVFQKSINLGYIKALRDSLPASPTDVDLARFAFGLDRQSAMPSIQQAGPQAYSFLSPSNDLRVLDNGLVAASQVSGFPTAGHPVAFFVVAVGFGANHLNAIHVENRLVLYNGSHRAYALREAGITHTPCLVQRVGLRDELEIVGSGELSQHPDRYLKGTRPPLLKDYFDPLLRTVVQVGRKNRLVQVQAQFGQSDIPAG